jgi:hypothetical protein
LFLTESGLFVDAIAGMLECGTVRPPMRSIAMAEPIIFVDSPAPRVDDGVVFFARRGSEPFQCRVTREFLVTRFGNQAPRDPLGAYEEHKAAIHAVAHTLISNGRASGENKITITSDSFALKDVTFSKSVRELPEYGYALKATAFLEEVLGESAALVTAVWDRKEGGPVTLTLSDGIGIVTKEFPTGLLGWDRWIYAELYGLWGDLLQVRSDIQHRKVQELAASLAEE